MNRPCYQLDQPADPNFTGRPKIDTFWPACVFKQLSFSIWSENMLVAIFLAFPQCGVIGFQASNKNHQLRKSNSIHNFSTAMVLHLAVYKYSTGPGKSCWVIQPVKHRRRRPLGHKVKLLAKDRNPIEAALWRLQGTLKELVAAEASHGCFRGYPGVRHQGWCFFSLKVK